MSKQHALSATKFSASLVLLLLLSSSVGVFLTGCSGGDNGTANTAQMYPEIKPVAFPLGISSASHVTSTMVRGENSNLFSWLLDTVTEGLQEGITTWIGDKTTGRILDIITHQTGDNSAALSEMNSKMVAVSGQLQAITNQLGSLSDELQISTVDVKNYITGTNLQSHISVIKSAYQNSDESGYLGIAAMATDPAHTTTDANLKSYISAYYNKYNLSMQNEIGSIHDLICPDVDSLKGVLKDYADKIILAVPSKNGLSDADNAYDTYLLLETYFAQILNYQTQANIIATELKNYNDPTGGLTNVWLNGNASGSGTPYKTLLKDEVARFQQTVNYLMVNAIDYRTAAKFKNDAKYMNAQGIAPDDTYRMVFARSRFFSAQVLKSFENDFGLVGSIVTPYDYSPGLLTPVTQVTFKFTGPVTKTVTVNAASPSILSQFPYTKWSHANAYSYPDNKWSFYDFNGLTDLPAGTYKVTLVEDSSSTSPQNTPWYHTTTDFGTVNVMYYDPTQFNPATATTVQTDTNTLKFGYFSGRWDWGYSRLSASPMWLWVKPDKTSYIVHVNGNGGGVSYSETNPTVSNNSNTYYPKIGAALTAVNTFGMTLPWETDYKGMQPTLAYTLNLPVVITGAPGDANTASAQLYYSTGGTLSYNLSGNSLVFGHAYYDYLLVDTTKNGPTYKIDNFSSLGTDYFIDNPVGNNGVMPSSSTIVPNRVYNFSVDGGFNALIPNYNPGFAQTSLHGQMDLNWNMQVVYTNKYKIFE